MENDTIEQKQQFLRTNVLEKGYNVESFIELLKQKKGGQKEVDLNEWSMEELTTVVQEFIGEKDIEQIGNYNNDNSTPNLNKTEEPKFEKFSPSENSDEFIVCKKTEVTTLSTRKYITCSLSDPQKKEGGFFGGAYTTYEVDTDPFNFKVRKRYSDFDWLRNYLISHYVNCVIPPMSKKNIFNRFDEVVVHKRMVGLAMFVNGVLAHPILQHAPVLCEFLKNDNPKDVAKMKEKYNKDKVPTCAEEVITLNGFIKTGFNSHREENYKYLKKVSGDNEETLRKLSKLYKEIGKNMGIISDKMKETAKLWNIMLTKAKANKEREVTCETYNMLGKFMEDWSGNYVEQKNLLETNFRYHFKYIKNEFRSWKEYSSKLEVNRNIYYKARDKLREKKEKLFNGKDLSLWGIDGKIIEENRIKLLQDKEYAFNMMLPNDSKKVEVLKKFYGMYLNSITDEFERILDNNSSKHKAVLNNFWKTYCQAMDEFRIKGNRVFSGYTGYVDNGVGNKPKFDSSDDNK